MKRIHPLIFAPPSDQFQFYLLTGRTILFFSIILLQLLYVSFEPSNLTETMNVTILGVSAYALIILVSSFFSAFIKRYIYFFLLGLFYLLMLVLVLAVYRYDFGMQMVFTYTTISMFLCLFFHRKLQLLSFQFFCLTLIVIAAFFQNNPEGILTDYIIRLVIFYAFLYLAVGFRIDKGLSMRQQDAQYKRLFERLNDGVMYIDNHGRIQLVNEQLCRLTKYKEKELVGMKVDKVILKSEHFFSSDDKSEKKIEETSLMQNEGKKIWVRLNAAPMLSEKGKLHGHIGICSDISARKEAEINLRKYAERLVETNNELEQFSYFASHDLKAPIHTISSMAQVLSKQYPLGKYLDQEAAKSIELIAGNTKRMNKLVDALLVYSSSGIEAINKAEVDMNEVVKDAMDNLAAYIQASDAQIRVEKLPLVHADKVQMTRLIQNLLENSLLYRKEEIPLVEIGARYDPNLDAYIFSVADNGIGIDTEHHEKIFLMFQKLHSLESSGLGIGLAICKKIAENHEGKIWLESKNGAGTAVYFSIPKKVSK